MPRHRHALTAVATALILAVSSAGCADSATSPVTLRLVAADYTVTGRSDSTERYWDDLIAAFEDEHPQITVEVDVVSWDDVDRQVTQMVKKGDVPDIAQIGTYAAFAEQGLLYSAEELLSIPVYANFLPPLVAVGKQKDKQYGMPFVASTRVLFYNKKLFAEAGIDAPPATWDELADTAEELRSGTGVAYPVAVPLGPEEAQIETMLWMLGGGGGYTAATGSYTINSKENIDSLNWVKQNLVKTGLTGPVPPGELNRKEAYEAFLRGEVGMVNGFPTLLQTAEETGIEIGMAPVPSRDAESTRVPAVADWIMAFKRNGHRKEVGKFLDFLFSDKNVREFAVRNNLLPVTGSVTEDMELDDRHRDLREFLSALPGSELPPFGKTSWAAVSDSIKRNIGTSMAPGGSPAGALNRIAGDAEEAEAASYR
ncbi:ABC transporter substrate-binding protein [Streptomyces sp. 058-1L]|uniref:ABC transporter substrate-binding protein n=1 Tax=Streptomyces sp. 058-1L TaxID=2789266 RepID=UPI0039817A70